MLLEAYRERRRRESWNSGAYYKAFTGEMKKVLHDDYRARLKFSPEGGDGRPFYTKKGTLLARNYTRVVIGDYGAYVEFAREHMALDQLRDKFPSRQTQRRVKYWWLVPLDGSNTKVYEQVRTVTYADYRAGFYYICPTELFNSLGTRLALLPPKI